MRFKECFMWRVEICSYLRLTLKFSLPHGEAVPQASARVVLEVDWNTHLNS